MLSPADHPALHPAIAALNPPTSRTDLFGILDQLGIAHATHEHDAVFTVDEGHEIKAALPGGHTKNLFLKSKKNELVLVCALGETPVRLNGLHRQIGTARLSFGSAELLWDHLGVTPGSVTIFALINDLERHIQLVLDAALLACDPVNFHPLENTATTAISRDDLLRFVTATGREPQVVDFEAIAQA